MWRQRWEAGASPRSPGEVQRMLEEALVHASAKKAEAWAVFDIDSTLYEIRPRTLAILRDFAATHGETRLAEALGRIDFEKLGYDLEDAFHAAGLDPAEHSALLARARSFWEERFFANDYLGLDVPYDGAVAFTEGLARAGFRILYLTGRDEGGMGHGTRESLSRHGFPLGEGRGEIALKPHKSIDDGEHKVRVIRELVDQGRHISAVFENEPWILGEIAPLYPSAHWVFVDTICSRRTPRHFPSGLISLSRFV